MSAQEHSDKSVGRWERWTDREGTMYVKITLTAQEQRQVGPRFWEMMQEAGRLIEAAFKEPD